MPKPKLPKPPPEGSEFGINDPEIVAQILKELSRPTPFEGIPAGVALRLFEHGDPAMDPFSSEKIRTKGGGFRGLRRRGPARVVEK